MNANKMQNAIDSLKSLWPTIAETTSKARASYLIKLGLKQDSAGHIDYSVLRDVDSTMSKVKDSENVNTRATRIFHIIEFLKKTDDSSLLDVYTELMKSIKESSNQAQMNNTLANDPRADRYVQLSELQDILISKEAMTLANSNGIKSFQDYLLMCLYVLNPALRNDFHSLKIVSKAADLTAGHNYLVINPRACYVYLNEYKNAKSNGAVRVNLSAYTVSIIRKLMALHKASGYKPQVLFNHVSTKKREISPMTEDALKKRVKFVSEVYFSIPLSINDYRHIWEIYIQSSDEYRNLSIADKEALHAKLLHRLNTAIKYNRV